MAMTEKEVLEQLKQLTEVLAGKDEYGQQKPVEISGSVQDNFDYIRIALRYLIFDLEATCRENGYLRKMLKETRGDQ
jgi:hypothetical protein